MDQWKIQDKADEKLIEIARDNSSLVCEEVRQIALREMVARMFERSLMTSYSALSAFGKFRGELRNILAEKGISSNPGWTDQDCLDAVRKLPPFTSGPDGSDFKH